MKFKIFDTEKKEFKKDINSDCFYINRKGVLHYEVVDCETGHSEIKEARKDLIPIYSTGLKDKNGKEYEDCSIVRIHADQKGMRARVYDMMEEHNVDFIDIVIGMNENYLGFTYKTTEKTKEELVFSEWTGDISFLWYLSKNGSLEIIGSSLTNPELLNN